MNRATEMPEFVYDHKAGAKLGSAFFSNTRNGIDEEPISVLESSRTVNGKQPRDVKKLFNLSKKLNHPCLLKACFFHELPSSSSVQAKMLSNGYESSIWSALRKKKDSLGPMSVEDWWTHTRTYFVSIYKDVVHALAYLHSQNYQHGDFSGSIMVSEDGKGLLALSTSLKALDDDGQLEDLESLQNSVYDFIYFCVAKQDMLQIHDLAEIDVKKEELCDIRLFLKGLSLRELM